jgi:hypothetical protein
MVGVLFAAILPATAATMSALAPKFTRTFGIKRAKLHALGQQLLLPAVPVAVLGRLEQLLVLPVVLIALLV